MSGTSKMMDELWLSGEREGQRKREKCFHFSCLKCDSHTQHTAHSESHTQMAVIDSRCTNSTCDKQSSEEEASEHGGRNRRAKKEKQ